MPPKEHKNQPDFFIIGAPKCGTTTLYSWLKKHSQIFMPESKEPHYFAQHLSDRYCRIREEESYRALFFGAEENQICGEASVLYGFYPESIQAILDHNPEAKIIYMLRHPIDMLVSYHGQLLVNLEEDQKSFEAAWKLSDPRKNGAKLPKTMQDLDLLDYPKIGALGHDLEKIMEIVPENQLLVILLDDMASDPKATHQKILSFLNVEAEYLSSYEKENEAAAVKSQFMQKLITSQNFFVKILKSIARPFLSNQARQDFNRTKRRKEKFSDEFLSELHDTYQTDIQILENYFNKPLKTSYKRSKES